MLDSNFWVEKRLVQYLHVCGIPFVLENSQIGFNVTCNFCYLLLLLLLQCKEGFYFFNKSVEKQIGLVFYFKTFVFYFKTLVYEKHK